MGEVVYYRGYELSFSGWKGRHARWYGYDPRPKEFHWIAVNVVRGLPSGIDTICDVIDNLRDRQIQFASCTPAA